MQIQCKYRGIKGILKTYDYAVRLAHMITEKAKHRAKVLTFWKTYGLKATKDAFNTKRSTLYEWQRRLRNGNGKLETLNPGKRTPQTKRKRIWKFEIIQMIKELRTQHPNLGKDKIYDELEPWCRERGWECPSESTIGRIIKDAGGLRIYPQKVSHFGKVKKLKRVKKLRKPKDFIPQYPGHLVALDTIVRIVMGRRIYIITFVDIYSRVAFAYATTSHASKAAADFFILIQKAFPYKIKYLITDNGSEFMKHFSEELKRQHVIHWHTYPRCPKMNAHCERFNRTIQEEFVDFHAHQLLNTDIFNAELANYLIWYNTKRSHHSLNRVSPFQFLTNYHHQSSLGWTYTLYCKANTIAVQLFI